MKLKYGMNPNQDFAELVDNDNLELLNGNPSIINILDALNSWQLVREMDGYAGVPAAASFKHVTPSGTAVGRELSESEKNSYQYNRDVTSRLTMAYLRARGADRQASFGDFIALSRSVDEETAALIKTEVSDGIIAPGYDGKALDLLSSKKKGAYVVFRINRDYFPEEMEGRTVFGFRIRQKRNNILLDDSRLQNIVTAEKDIQEEARQNAVLGMITLKYTQSNSICIVHNGQAVGIGSGQQSRILCTELALSKANRWYQKILLDYNKLTFPEGASKTARGQIIEEERARVFDDRIVLDRLDNLCLCSDGFFPHTDNIEKAHEYGVKVIAAPMGSIRDNDIIKTCNDLGMVFINTGVRLFHH